MREEKRFMFIDKNGNINYFNLISYPDDDYNHLKTEALKCERCVLRKNANQVVMGKGSTTNKIMLIGEGPGADEDRIGEPFVGRAGKLLDKILKAVEINKEDLYITNIVKCRPPNNRTPFKKEAESCAPILVSEIKLIEPKVIVPLGSVPLKYIVNDNASITKMRGKWIKRGKIYIFPTFHPSYLLRNPKIKKYSWHDFKVIKKAFERIKVLQNK